MSNRPPRTQKRRCAEKLCMQRGILRGAGGILRGAGLLMVVATAYQQGIDDEARQGDGGCNSIDSTRARDQAQGIIVYTRRNIPCAEN